LHYYGSLLVLPIAAGEIARSVVGRRARWEVWAALAIGLAPLLAFFPLMRAASAYSVLFWSRPSPGQLPYVYRFFLFPALLPATILLAVAAVARVVGRLPESRLQPTTDRPAWLGDVTVLIALFLLPIVGILVGVWTGSFRDRYTISMVLGFAGLVAALASLERVSHLVPLASLVLIGWISVRGVAAILGLQPGGQPFDVMAVNPLLDETDISTSDDIVIANDATFTQLEHYGPAALRRRLVFVLPPRDTARPRREDSSERAMRALARWRPIRVEEYDHLVRRTGTFFLYGESNWLPDQLRHDGARVEWLGMSYGRPLMKATRPHE
jgi:hypothetical protein